MNFFISNPVNNILMYEITKWKSMIILCSVKTAQLLSQFNLWNYSTGFRISPMHIISN